MEEFKPQTYFCMKYYDESGKRISIRAHQLNREKMIIELWRASKRDKFLKKFSRKIFNALEEHHAGEIKEKFGVTIESLVIDVDGDYPKREFLQWCNWHFCKPYKIPNKFRTKYITGKEMSTGTSIKLYKF